MDRLWPPARRALAAALLAAGKAEAAATEWRALAPGCARGEGGPGRLLIARTLRLPAAERKWDEVEVLLDDVPAGDKRAAALLKAEVLAAQNKLADARAGRGRARPRPRGGGPLAPVGRAGRTGGGGRAALPVLAEAETRAGPRAAWALPGPACG